MSALWQKQTLALLFNYLASGCEQRLLGGSSEQFSGSKTQDLIAGSPV
jgi:hypothetical protein